MNKSPLVETLQALARVPSAVPLGRNTLIDPDDPLLVEYVQNNLRPLLASSAPEVVDLPLNQFAARFGTGDGPCLALMAYTPTQHHNLMSHPWSGHVAPPPGVSEPAVFGQGVSQNKAHQACLIALTEWLAADEDKLDGTLWLCVNNEGRSTHDCSDAILNHLPGPPPDLLIQLFPTDFKVSVGNRGRSDLCVHVGGNASHSSMPPSSGRVIDAVGEVLRTVQRLNEEISDRRHPRLGSEQAIVYQVSFAPEAPHTLPSQAKVVVDRRFVPPTTAPAAAAELKRVLGDIDVAGCDISVEQGVTMLPALLADDATDAIRPLEEAIDTVLGGPAERVIHGGAFDAGGPMARGIPTVMFGAPEEGDFLGDDYMRISALEQEVAILQQTIRNFFEHRRTR